MSSINNDSLWPTDFGEVSDIPPLVILRQQGTALGELTQNIVVGRVETLAHPGGFDQRFFLYCGPLGIGLPLLQVRHRIELKEKLRGIFARQKTKEIIASLLAQSKE
jgi:hypothetical protein